jgi:hypothetical protein
MTQVGGVGWFCIDISTHATLSAPDPQALGDYLLRYLLMIMMYNE